MSRLPPVRGPACEEVDVSAEAVDNRPQTFGAVPESAMLAIVHDRPDRSDGRGVPVERRQMMPEPLAGYLQQTGGQDMVLGGKQIALINRGPQQERQADSVVFRRFARRERTIGIREK